MTRLLAEYVYVGAGVAVVLTTAGAEVVVDGTTVGTGVAVTVPVGAGVTAGCDVDVVVVQPAIRHANSRRHAILMYTKHLPVHIFCIEDHFFQYLICVIYDKLFYLIFCKC